MKKKEVFTKYDKHLLAKEWKKRKPIAYITKDGIHLSIYAHKENSIIGMKFIGEKYRPFIAKLQPNQFFTVVKDYFPLQDLRYYDDSQERIAYPSALKPLQEKPREDYAAEDPKTKIYSALMEGSSVMLTVEEMQQLNFTTKEPGEKPEEQIDYGWKESPSLDKEYKKLW